MFQSTNPALKHDEVWDSGISASDENAASIQGVVNKTSMLAMIAAVGGMFGIWLVTNQPTLAMPLGILGFILSLVAYFVIIFKPMRAKYFAWVYALIQGAFLGSITFALDNILINMGYAAAGGLALQAFAITISVLISMLALYYFNILKPTKMFTTVICVLTLGIFVTYFISFIMSLFGAQMPFLTLASAFEGGQTAMIGLGLNLFILAVASLWLIIDFGMVEQHVKSGEPKQMEWFCGFILIVSLVWIYLEALKLCFRLAIILGNRR